MQPRDQDWEKYFYEQKLISGKVLVPYIFSTLSVLADNSVLNIRWLRNFYTTAFSAFLVPDPSLPE